MSDTDRTSERSVARENWVEKQIAEATAEIASWPRWMRDAFERAAREKERSRG